jgi:hypothetical protein
MQEFDPALLRRLAARYRERANEEPIRASLFREVADDMEAHARRIEQAGGPGD